MESKLLATYAFLSESQAVTMGEEQVGEVGMGAVSRLELTGPGSEGLSVRICVDRGVVVVYGSYTSPNPNLVLHDFSEVLRAPDGEVTPASCSTSYITLDDVNARSEDEDTCTVCRSSRPVQRKRQTSEERDVVVYITIEGTSNATSQFTVSSEIGAAFGEDLQTMNALDMLYFSFKECADSFCGANAVLIRVDGSCFCECMQGYEGDGHDCNSMQLNPTTNYYSFSPTDADECALGTSTCSENEKCVDTVGSYTCTCKEGYKRNDLTCSSMYLS